MVNKILNLITPWKYRREQVFKYYCSKCDTTFTTDSWNTRCPDCNSYYTRVIREIKDNSDDK